MKILKKLFEIFFGTKQQRDIKKLRPLVKKVNEREEEIAALSNDELHDKTAEFQSRLKNGEMLDDIQVEAFAVVREVSKRVLKMRHFDVQMMGGAVLNSGKIAEMRTGEGKTLVATLAMYLNALEGKGAHLVTVNDYLAKRDAEWMGPVYLFLGLSVGIINHDRKSYRLEWDDISEYTVRSISCERRDAYKCDITYGTNNEFGFDYLRDNMVFSLNQKVQRGFNYAIVDEVDSILIDEARTPLIISGPSDEATELYYKVDKVIPRLTEAELDEKKDVIEGTGDFAIYEKDKNAVLTMQGAEKAAKLLGITDLYSPNNTKLLHHLTQALRAHKIYQKDVQYVVEGGEVVIVDEFTGRKMPGRRWSDGLHQAIEAKERLTIKREFQTLATVTFQNYFKMYTKLAGMTGTAETEATEFYSIYKLDVTVIPTNKPIARLDAPDKIFINERAKFKKIVKDVEEMQKNGQPVLIGTVSVEKSEVLSKMFKQHGIRHNVLNAKYHEKEAEIVTRAGQTGSVTIATNMAGRGTDIKLGEGVREAGGLFVLGSERHEARRIDNQLRGRSGRQGDPGGSQFYVSLTDDLMRLFGMDRRAGIMEKMGLSEEEEIVSKPISKAIEKAQKRVEGRNFEIRKNLLEYDNVMNEQRSYSYGLRDKLLELQKNPGVVDDLIDEMIPEFLDSNFENSTKPYTWDTDRVNLWFKTNFNTDVDFEFSHTSYEDAIDEFKKTIHGSIYGRFSEIPKKIVTEAIKYVLLRQLDLKWKAHLKNIDSLKEGIGLRSYAQKNPIVEYKLEAYNLFIQLKADFKIEAFRMLSRLQIKQNFEAPAEDEKKEVASNTTEVHNELGQYDSMKSKQSQQQNQTPFGGKPQPIVSVDKVGPNDPCPCGSGKKYKHCCRNKDQ